MSLAYQVAMRWVALTFIPALLGCALTTAGPPGPLRSGTSTQIQFTSAVAYGPAAATVGGVRVSGNAETMQLGGKSVVDPLPNPVPVTIAIRQQVGPSFEVSVDLGWVDSGVGLRLRLPSSESLPFVLSAGARTAEIGIFRHDTYQGALAIEVYPALSRTREGWNAARLVPRQPRAGLDQLRPVRRVARALRVLPALGALAARHAGVYPLAWRSSLAG
jgi:hypothetical protein